MVSSQPLRGFSAVLSPDQLPRRIIHGPSSLKLRRAPCFAPRTRERPAKRASAKQDGADGENRTRVVSQATSGSAIELRPDVACLRPAGYGGLVVRCRRFAPAIVSASNHNTLSWLVVRADAWGTKRRSRTTSLPAQATQSRRLVRPRGFEPLVGRPACFTDAGFTDRWQERDAMLVAGRGVAPRSKWLMRPPGSLTDLPASTRWSGVKIPRINWSVFALQATTDWACPPKLQRRRVAES